MNPVSYCVNHSGEVMDAEKLKELLSYDPKTGVFRWKIAKSTRVKPGDITGCDDRGYLRIKIDGKRYRAHRLAWLYVYGVWPKQSIDHINRDKADNRIANLREATNSLNGFNRGMQRNNSSGYKGIYYHKPRGKWVAQIRIDGVAKYIGLYKTPEEAHAAYCDALRCVCREQFGQTE